MEEKGEGSGGKGEGTGNGVPPVHPLSYYSLNIYLPEVTFCLVETSVFAY